MKCRPRFLSRVTVASLALLAPSPVMKQSTFTQDYDKLTHKVAVVRSAQTKINELSDYIRRMVEENMDEFRGDINAIYLMGTINISTFLFRKGLLLVMALIGACMCIEIQFRHNKGCYAVSGKVL